MSPPRVVGANLRRAAAQVESGLEGGGDGAKWQGRGLQNLHPQFDSGRRLHIAGHEPLNLESERPPAGGKLLTLLRSVCIRFRGEAIHKRPACDRHRDSSPLLAPADYCPPMPSTT